MESSRPYHANQQDLSDHDMTDIHDQVFECGSKNDLSNRFGGRPDRTGVDIF